MERKRDRAKEKETKGVGMFIEPRDWGGRPWWKVKRVLCPQRRIVLLENHGLFVKTPMPYRLFIESVGLLVAEAKSEEEAEEDWRGMEKAMQQESTAAWSNERLKEFLRRYASAQRPQNGSVPLLLSLSSFSQPQQRKVERNNSKRNFER